VQVSFVDLQGQYQAIQSDVDSAIKKVLHKSDYILGQAVSDFEAAFATYCGTDHVVGVDSGLSALELILRGYHIGAGDEVITMANTFYSTVVPIMATGAQPVLVDTHLDTYNIDPEKIEAAITPRTRAIMAVHLYGQPADMDPILEIARRHDLRVIEDAAQAHGAWYKGRRTGSLGDAAGFSFYPAKNLGCYGDGGAVATSDPALAERVRMLRNLGQRQKNHHEIQGFNRRLDTLQAAILSVNLSCLDSWNANRRRIADQYRELFEDLPVVCPFESPDVEHVYHLYVIRSNHRDALRDHLQEAGVATGVHYPVPIHLQPAFQTLNYQQGRFPIAEQYASEILSLPMHPFLRDDEVAYVAQSIREFASRM
jgi:dTDP-4-amino-4,6-dideoxygalactose transaminase